MTWWRLTYRLQAPGILFSAAVCLGLAAAAAWLAIDMRSALASCGAPNEPSACTVIFAFQNTHGNAVYMVQAGMGLAQFGVPLVLGVPILTREIEQRTAMIAWPLAGSRLRWLAWRVIPVIVVGAVLLGVMAVAAEQLAQAYFPHADIGFAGHGSRGTSLVMRSALVLTAAVLLGAMIGRLLPALLIGIALSIGVSTGMDAALPHWVEPAELSQSDSIFSGANPLNTGFEYRDANGTPLDDQEAELMMQAIYEEHGPEPDPALLPQEVFYGVAASRYGEVLLRESGALVAGTVLLGGAAVIVVARRRPE
jgi:hypothetical protein